MRRSTIPVLLLAALSFFAGLGRGAISDSDEAFYAESAREMVESGDWLTPHFNYEPRLQKPALYYWLTATVFLATGPTEFSARLWSALSGVGLVLVTTACGRKWFDELTGLLAGAITATAFGYFALARLSLPDLPLAFLITLSIWAAFVATLDRERRPTRWVLLAAVAMALGCLMKGPLAIVIPVLVVLPTLLIERRSFNIRLSDLGLATLLFALIAAPWYVAMWTTHGTAYLQQFFLGDNLERFTTTRFNDPRPWWFYLPIVAGGLLPWTPLALVWASPLLQFLRRRRDTGALDLRLLLWAVLPLIFFSWSIGKQPRYVLPVLPPMALLLASSIVERTSEWRSLDGTRVRPRPSRPVVVGCVLSGAVLVLLAALLYRAQPLFLGVSATLTVGVAILIGIAGLAVMVVSLTSGWRAAPAMLALASAVTFAALPYGALTSPEDSAVVKMARMVRDARSNDEPIGTYKVFVRNLVFYAKTKHLDLIHDEHLLDFVSHNSTVLIVLPAADAARLEQHPGVKLQRLGELSYFEAGSLRLEALLWPNPERDIERVVLARVTSSRSVAR